MKNIGSKLKKKREEDGLSIEEVAEDLKMRPSQIESIEEGRTEDFKDVFYLKYFLRDYAKYLGLDSEQILDEFSEYLFDITSKEKKEDKKDKNSPYTKDTKKEIKSSRIIIGIVSIIVLIIIGYIIISNYEGNDFSNNNITYSIRR